MDYHKLSLDELAHLEIVPELWTDKRSPRVNEQFVCHDYLRIYDREWAGFRHQPIALLEIGLNVGASVRLWQQYFSEAHIFGIDIADFNPKVEIDKDRFSFSKGSAFDPYFLEEYRNTHPLFDIIIDDGSHFSGPIAVAFAQLWGHVKPGGWYVIEDLGEVRNPDSHSDGFPNQTQLALGILENVVLGRHDYDKAIVFKELVMLKKKL